MDCEAPTNQQARTENEGKGGVMGAIEKETITRSLGTFLVARAREEIRGGKSTVEAFKVANHDALAIALEAYALYALADCPVADTVDVDAARAIMVDVLHVMRDVFRNPGALRKRSDFVRALMPEWTTENPKIEG
jgi:hypothetical protein